MSRKKQSNSQREIVLKHLTNYNTITSMEAFNHYGITRLSSIIFNLRNEGYGIKSKICYGTNCQGNDCHWAEYMLIH